MSVTKSKAGEFRSDLVEEVRREIQRVVESAAFRGSNRCRTFLEFVVARALDGDADSLKERTLATEVFGRKAASDLTEDSIVRVGAREVRKRLAQYYFGEGAENPVRIELPAGSYVPVFHEIQALKPVLEVAPHPIAPLTHESAPAPKRRFRVSPWTIVLATVVVAAALLVFRSPWFQRSQPEFDAFWRPTFSQNTPVLIALAHPLVYHPTTRATMLTERRDGPQLLPGQRPLDVPPQMLSGSDFVPVFDQYVGFGDTVAAMRIGALFAQRSRPVRVRIASKLDFNDLRDSATILIGAFTNRWTTELTQDYRYRFAYDELRRPCIVDSSTGKRRWLLDKADDGRSKEDYILICRVPRSSTGRLLLVGAGLTQYGTQEAGRILAEPDSLAPLLRQLPSNWTQRNMELVLRSQVVGDAPTPPELAAWHLW